MVYTDNQPFKIVDNVGFCNLIIKNATLNSEISESDSDQSQKQEERISLWDSYLKLVSKNQNQHNHRMQFQKNYQSTCVAQ